MVNDDTLCFNERVKICSNCDNVFQDSRWVRAIDLDRTSSGVINVSHCRRHAKLQQLPSINLINPCKNHIPVTFGDNMCDILLDTGAQISVLSVDIFHSLPSESIKTLPSVNTPSKSNTTNFIFII